MGGRPPGSCASGAENARDERTNGVAYLPAPRWRDRDLALPHAGANTQRRTYATAHEGDRSLHRPWPGFLSCGRRTSRQSVRADSPNPSCEHDMANHPHHRARRATLTAPTDAEEASTACGT